MISITCQTYVFYDNLGMQLGILQLLLMHLVFCLQFVFTTLSFYKIPILPEKVFRIIPLIKVLKINSNLLECLFTQFHLFQLAMEHFILLL
jgi:hypothetical protein